MNKYVSISLVIVFVGFLIIVYSVTKLFYPAYTDQTGEVSMKFEDFGSKKSDDSMMKEDQAMHVDPKTTIAFSSEESTYSVGDSVVVDVLIETVSDLVATELVIIYDNTVLEFSDAEAGSFFANPREVGPTIESSGVKYMQLSLPQDGESTGEGEIVKMYFTAVGEGSTTLDLGPKSIIGALGADGQNDLKSTTPLTINVQ